MALVKCKDCGNAMSTRAKSCPSCGAPAAKRTSIVTKLVLVIIGIGVVGAIFGSHEESVQQEKRAQAEAARRAAMTPDQRAAEDTAKAKADQLAAQKKATKDKQWQNVMVAMAMVKKQLRDPNSLEWIRVRADETGSVVCSEYRARNGFGGMNVEHTASVAGIPVTGADAWNKYCVQSREIIDSAPEGFAMAHL